MEVSFELGFEGKEVGEQERKKDPCKTYAEKKMKMHQYVVNFCFFAEPFSNTQVLVVYF